MSLLVGYGSSSDEEDGTSKPTEAADHVPLPPSAELPFTSVAAQHAVQNDLFPREQSTNGALGRVQGPTLGPSEAEQFEEATTPTPLADMPERDAIRYLTQAPVPAASIPLSAPGSPDPTANAKFKKFVELKTKGVHFNEDLAKKQSFRNPSLLSTMVARAGIEEQAKYNTSLPLDLWNPTEFPDWAYKEGLLKSQKELQGKGEAEKKALSVSGKRVIDFASESGSGQSSRRSTPGQQSKRKRP